LDVLFQKNNIKWIKVIKWNIYVDIIQEFGEIIIKSDGEYITGLYLESQTGFNKAVSNFKENGNSQVIQKAVKWLDTYFKGKEPKENLKLKLEGTNFQKEVWNILMKIPYGKCITYGDIAKEIANKRGINRMSSQACRRCCSAQIQYLL